jgi:hypothetical protein
MRKLVVAVALLGLAGCHAFVAEHYHPTSEFPPTPTAESAVDVCHAEGMSRYWAETGGAFSGLLARESASFKDCMERHGYERNVLGAGVLSQ